MGPSRAPFHCLAANVQPPAIVPFLHLPASPPGDDGYPGHEPADSTAQFDQFLLCQPHWQRFGQCLHCCGPYQTFPTGLQLPLTQLALALPIPLGLGCVRWLAGWLAGWGSWVGRCVRWLPPCGSLVPSILFCPPLCSPNASRPPPASMGKRCPACAAEGWHSGPQVGWPNWETTLSVGPGPRRRAQYNSQAEVDSNEGPQDWGQYCS